MREPLNDAQKDAAELQANAAAADRLMIERQVFGNENFFYSQIPFINEYFNPSHFL